jgi:hypothetical protein
LPTKPGLQSQRSWPSTLEQVALGWQPLRLWTQVLQFPPVQPACAGSTADAEHRQTSGLTHEPCTQPWEQIGAQKMPSPL